MVSGAFTLDRGGPQMTNPNGYRLAAETLGKAEIDAAKAVLDTGMLTMGADVHEFEKAFARWVGVDHAVMVNSGSSANLIASDALVRRTSSRPPLAAGDEVLVPGLAWPTTVWPLAQLGLVPVFVDIDARTLGLDLMSAEAAMGPRTRAMVIIHPLGRALDVSAYKGFCETHDLALIEDCCESLGAFSEGRHVGTSSMAGTFSFYFSHHVSTIEGGMVVTQDSKLADDLRGLRAHGWIRDRADRQSWIDANPDLDPRFLFATVDYNVRPTNVQAAIGSVQLDRLDQMLESRELLARWVSELVGEWAPWLELLGRDQIGEDRPSARQERTHSWMTLPFRVHTEAPVTAQEVMACLEAGGVETRAIIAGNLARHPAIHQIAHRADVPLARCDELLETSFMIGCHPVLADATRRTLEHAIRDLSQLA